MRKTDLIELVKEFKRIGNPPERAIISASRVSGFSVEFVRSVFGGTVPNRKRPDTREHCAKGHQMTAENVYVFKTGTRAGHRRCRMCVLEQVKKCASWKKRDPEKERIRARDYRARKRASA